MNIKKETKQNRKIDCNNNNKKMQTSKKIQKAPSSYTAKTEI